MIQSGIGNAYQLFLATVGQARNKPPQEIDAVAQGRIWTGAQAKDRGLVDQLGGLRDVVAAAAKRAQLAVDTTPRYIEQTPGRLQMLLQELGVGEADLPARVLAAMLPSLRAVDPLQALLPAAPQAVVDGIRRDLGWLAAVAEHQRPFDTAAHCLCTAP